MQYGGPVVGTYSPDSTCGFENIDGKKAFLGGFNVADEYIGKVKKFGNWRDTHMLFVGEVVNDIHLRFMQDWNYASGKNLFGEPKYYMEAAYGKRDACKVQIIAGGPDHKGQNIRDNYLYLIYKARKSIY